MAFSGELLSLLSKKKKWAGLAAFLICSIIFAYNFFYFEEFPILHLSLKINYFLFLSNNRSYPTITLNPPLDQEK